MYRSYTLDPEAPPISKRRCPACGVPMFLAQIVPTAEADHDERTFECSKCEYGETVVVKLRYHRIELA